MEIFDGKHDPSRRPAARGQVHQHIAADHLARELTGIGGRRLGGEIDLPVAHHADAVAHALHFIELVRDEDDGLAVGDKAAKEFEQAVGLAGREHRRRLVRTSTSTP